MTLSPSSSVGGAAGLPDLRPWSGWALFLDIDGTMIDLAARPESVQVPIELPGHLDRLRHALGGALAVISGRTLGEIDRLLPLELDAAGTHGAEWRAFNRAGGGCVTTVAARLDAAVIDGLLRQWGADRVDGLLVELKTHAVALHYRAMPAQRDRVQELAARLVTALGAGYRLLPGNCVWEVVPAGVDKGAAIERFLSTTLYRDRRPVFAGDDVTDESGFAVVKRYGGLAIAVGDRPSAIAQIRVESAQCIRSWLRHLAEH